MRSKPPKSSPGQAPSCIGHRYCPDRSQGEDLDDACGVGSRGMEARRGSGPEARMRASTSGNGPPVQARVGRRSPGGQAGR